MNQTEQMREALQAIEAVLGDAYDRHFAECCGRGNQLGCCGEPIEQWTPEDHKILDTLSPIQRKLSQALAAEPAPLVRLTQIERDRIAMSCQSTQQVISATIDAMIAKNGGRRDQ